MKNISFWVTFPLTVIVALIVGVIGSIAEAIIWLCEQVIELLHRWEGYCLNYEEDWKYLGSGIWKGKSDDE